MAKILSWDIEATNLSANFGTVLCIGYKWLGEDKTHMISVRDFKTRFKKDPTDDYMVLKEFAKVANEADVWVYHYGRRFDKPYVNTKLLMHGLPTLLDVQDIDTWWYARHKLKLNNNRLDTVQKAFNLPDSKTPLDGPLWRRAGAGHVPSLRKVEEHCHYDVLCLEEAYLTLRPVIHNHPNIALLDGVKGVCCTNCGSDNYVKKGLVPKGNSRVTLRQRYKCKDCHTNFYSRTAAVLLDENNKPIKPEVA